MTDKELKELSEKVWNQYWAMTKLSGLGSKFPDAIIPFLKTFFTSGFVEGYRTKEESLKRK